MVCSTVVILLLLSSAAALAASAPIREPAVAGRFYPADADKLAAAVRGFMEDARPAAGGRPIAIVSPHAGFIYSGQIAADAFAQAKGHSYDLIVILAPNHTSGGFKGVSVYADGGFRSPLGVAKVDSVAARHLMDLFPEATFDAAVHQDEHAIEVQVPFVQVLFPDTRILPVVVSLRHREACARFGDALARALTGRDALIVASSDLSHYPGYDDARRADRDTLIAMASLDDLRLERTLAQQEAAGIPGLSTCACGDRPVMAAMAAARALGATGGRIVSYANSGDALVGDPGRVVGYGAAAFGRFAHRGDTEFPEPPSPTVSSPLSPDQQFALLALARKTLTRYFRTETVPLPRFDDPALSVRQGAFVTLKRNGELRGCIGHMADDLPLCRVVGGMTLQAAFNDRRFPPLREKELSEIEIEISVLTPFRPVAGPDAIVIGRDGVVLRKTGRSAVFLPQVASEQRWGRDEMLTHLSRKAGLPEFAWRDGADLFTFQAQVFEESAFRRP